MPAKPPSGPRCAALVGPYLSGKTTLLESLLFATGAIARKGTVKDGNTAGDGSPAARSRKMSVEVSVASTTFMGEAWTFLDLPGSIEFANEFQTALMVADAAIVVCEPVPDRALMLAPLFKFLDDHAIPHLVFINKVDNASPRVREMMDALQAVSARPLVLRQVPLGEGDAVSGYVDLVSERAYQYQAGQASKLIPLPAGAQGEEKEARQGLLEKLADFDDKLLEQLLEEAVPPKEQIYEQLTKNLGADRLVPVLLGAADRDAGVRRLLKALRHEVPDASVAAERLGVEAVSEPTAQVFKTVYAAHTGKQSLARVWRGPIADGATVSDGTASVRIGGIVRLVGQQQTKLAKAETGEVVAFSRLEGIATGGTLTLSGKVPDGLKAWPPVPAPLIASAISAVNRTDDVKLSAALKRLVEEDPSLHVEHSPDTNELLLWGQGEIHLSVALDRLKTQYNVAVVGHPPQVPYKETIRRGITQHARHKRQSGGHGQFADVKVEIKPLARGGGFGFEEKVVGGAIPRNFIPAVEEGVRDYLKRGPLGFPVVDAHVTLFDGQYHDVDSSDMAFKTAGGLAMREGMPKCDPVLLEPICKVDISVPTEFTSKVQRIISTRRGQILGFDAKPDWSGWDQVSAYLPQSEMGDLIIELRSATMGVGSFTWSFDHLTELTGKLAERITAAAHDKDQKQAAS
jgi:elongation factor G